MDCETRWNRITNLLTYIFPGPRIVSGKCLQSSCFRESEPLQLVTILGNEAVARDLAGHGCRRFPRTAPPSRFRISSRAIVGDNEERLWPPYRLPHRHPRLQSTITALTLNTLTVWSMRRLRKSNFFDIFSGNQHSPFACLRYTIFFGAQNAAIRCVSLTLQDLFVGLPNREHCRYLLKNNDLIGCVPVNRFQSPAQRLQYEPGSLILHFGQVAINPIPGLASHDTFDECEHVIQRSTPSATTSDGERLAWWPTREHICVREICRPVLPDVTLDRRQSSRTPCGAGCAVPLDANSRHAKLFCCDIQAAGASEEVHDLGWLHLISRTRYGVDLSRHSRKRSSDSDRREYLKGLLPSHGAAPVTACCYAQQTS